MGRQRATDYDVLIVGSGFGGSVTALRLVEKGYRVGVLEAGRRYADADFAETSWDLKRFLWAPKFGCFGIQRVHLLRDCLILAGAGVGGGSLNYANTLYKPPASFFEDRQWAHITDWHDELSPYYDQARRILGVVTNPHMTPADEVIKSVAEDMGVGDTFIQTPVGVYFGEPGRTVADPYFGGVGPDRTGCIECGECMTGCRHGAKNTLVKNYLGLAEKAGAEIVPMTTVTDLRETPDGSWEVVTERTGAWRRNPDAKWRMRPGALEIRQKEQVAVLDRAVPLLKDGGRICYITCSVLDAENGAQVKAFVTRHPGFAVVPPADVIKALGDKAGDFARAARLSAEGVLMTPRTTGTDGFFVSVLRR